MGRHHPAPPPMDSELLEGVPLFQPDRGTHRSPSVRWAAASSRLEAVVGQALGQLPGLPPWTLPLGSARRLTLFSPPLVEGPRPGHAPSHGERVVHQQAKSQVLFWGAVAVGTLWPEACACPVDSTALPAALSLLALCPSVSASLRGRASSRCCLSLRALSPLWHSEPSRAWKGVGPTSWVGALLHTVGGVAWCVFFFSLFLLTL